MGTPPDGVDRGSLGGIGGKVPKKGLV